MRQRQSSTSGPGSRRAAGELEPAVLGILWDAGQGLRPGQVREQLEGAGGPGMGGLSYNTVVTILSRLCEKGALARTRDGRAYRYAPVAGPLARLLTGRADPRYATWLMTLAAAANPLLRAPAGAVDYTVERWADEHAAVAVRDRRLVAETIAQAAVATKATRLERILAAALAAVFGHTAGVSLAGAGPVPRRVAALLSPPPRVGAVAMVLGLALVTIAALCALEAANDLQDLLSLAHARAR